MYISLEAFNKILLRGGYNHATMHFLRVHLSLRRGWRGWEGGGGGSGHGERKAENKGRGESFLQQISVHWTGQDTRLQFPLLKCVKLESAVRTNSVETAQIGHK